jgi:hypothetical protein
MYIEQEPCLSVQRGGNLDLYFLSLSAVHDKTASTEINKPCLSVQREGKPGSLLPLTLSQTIKKNLLPAQGNFNTGILLSVYLYGSLKETLYLNFVGGFGSVILC